MVQAIHTIIKKKHLRHVDIANLKSEETHLTCRKCTPTSIKVQRHLRKQRHEIADRRNEGKTLNIKLSAVAVNYENMT